MTTAAELAARSVALAALADEESGAPLDRALDHALRRGGALAERDRALAGALAYESVRHRRRLEHWLSRTSGRRMAALDDVVRRILVLGAVQLWRFDSVPPYAAVSTSVELARRHRAARASGLINAVLRKLSAERAFLEAGAPRTARGIAVEHSYPDWLVERLVAEHGLEAAERLLVRFNRPAGLTLRLAPGERPDEVLAELEELDLDPAPSPWIPGAVRVGATHPGSLPIVAGGRARVQDEAAQAVVWSLGAAPGERVLEVCAGLGGKALALADLGAHVVAGDRSAGRLAMLVRAPLASGRRRPWPLRWDAAVPLPFRGAPFSKVLVDAPCTGLGTLRRHPEIKWRRAPADVERASLLQRRILGHAARVLAPGGRMVYATCSLLPEENEHVVRAVLDELTWLRSEPMAERLPAALASFCGADGFFRTYPDGEGMDGFFAASFRRVAGV